MPDRSFVRGELLLLLNLCGFSHVVRVDLLATFPLPHLDFDAPASLSSFLPYPSPHPLLPLPRNDSALFADSPRAPHLPLCACDCAGPSSSLAQSTTSSFFLLINNLLLTSTSSPPTFLPSTTYQPSTHSLHHHNLHTHTLPHHVSLRARRLQGRQPHRPRLGLAPGDWHHCLPYLHQDRHPQG
jgi:hypothetical protein